MEMLGRVGTTTPALLAAVTTWLMLLAGCASPSDTTVTAPESPETETTAPETRGGRDPKSGAAPVANPAPDFTVETFDGERFELAEQRGTPVVLNFWESW